MTDTSERAWTEDLASIAALCALGTRRQTVRRRVVRGSWQLPLPGVVCRTTGALTVRQWEIAALLYAGPGAALSHGTAGEYWGYGRSRGPRHVTVPHGRNLASTADVRIHQSRRPYLPVLIEGLSLTPPDRTAIDMCLAMTRQDDVVALLGRAIQNRTVSLDQLGAQLDAAPRRGSGRPRLVLAELAAGSRAASESQLLRLIQRAGLPVPELNGAVLTHLGTRYVDALWRGLRRGVEVDGQPFHLHPAAWQADLVRQNAIQTAGVVLLRIAARRLWTEPHAVVAEIACFLGLPVPRSLSTLPRP